MDKESSTCGPVVYYNGKPYVYDGESHVLYIGKSGKGKSRCGTISTVLSVQQAGESYIVSDPKGEIYNATYCFLKDKYIVHVIDFRNILESETWNPLELAYKLYSTGDKHKMEIAYELIVELAFLLFADSVVADPFWAQSARSLFIGIVYLLFSFAPADQINMKSVYMLAVLGEQRLGSTNYLRHLIDLLPKDTTASMNLNSYMAAPNETRGSIKCVFLDGMAIFARSEGLIEMLSSDGLNIAEMNGEKPVAIYIILPDESIIYDRLCGVLISQLMKHYMRLAQDEYKGRLPIRMHLILEELASVGSSISGLPDLMATSRSRNIKIYIVLQSLSQLDDLYGKSNASTILANIGIIIAFSTNDWKTLGELSQKCGDKEIDFGTRIVTTSLIKPEQLAGMDVKQALVMIDGSVKYITKLPFYDEIFDFSEWKEPAQLKHKKENNPKYFDITKYVQEGGETDLRVPMMLQNEDIFRTFNKPKINEEIKLQELITKIDKAIERLEGTEEIEEIEELKEIEKLMELDMQEMIDEEDIPDSYDIILYRCNSCENVIALVVAKILDVSYNEAVNKLKEEPQIFKFETRIEAERAKADIRNVGGDVYNLFD